MGLPKVTRKVAKYEAPAAIPDPPPAIPNVASEASNRNAISFLDLPAELRNAIYSFGLVLPDPLMVAQGRPHRCFSDRNYDLATVAEDPNIGSKYQPALV
jgi:hypothetical protein